MKRTLRILAGSILLVLAPLAPAQTTGTNDVDTQVRALDATAANKGQTQVATKIASSFTNLAGSLDNALALANALRNGTAVDLTTTSGTGSDATTTTTTFTPPTGPMGWGNVKIALALAQDALLKLGITKPTAAQLQAALLGGDVTVTTGTGDSATTTTTTLKGVLQMRADGMGWGQIAHAGGTKLGPVVSSIKATNTQLSALPAAGSSSTTTATASTSKGMTTAAGSSTTATGKGPTKGITTATGASATGMVTADGATSAHQPNGNAYGRGVITGTGASVGTNVSTAVGGKPAGVGVVTATGDTASGVTTAQSNAGGNGKGNAYGKGKGGG